ncbi:MAG TPA: AAA family ATPase, partial [Gemmataceae bacterium]|nr:AAA family ATPase [Gemmataceae bacterium]
LRSLGLIATTSSEGATPLKAKESKWTPELNRWFEGVQRVFIPEDNDDVGRKFAREKAQALAAMVADIRIVSFPDVPEGEDVSWWLQHGHSKEELLARCEAAPKASPATLQSVRASQVPMRAVQWLWQDRFALGKLGIFAGLPDEGKSMLSFYVSARITRPEQHKWPNGEGQAPQGNVILLTAEDDPEDTVVPRLVAAGADLDRVEIVSMVRDRDQGGLECERMFSLGDDLELLRQKIDQVGDVRAILIDPVTAYLGRAGAVDSYRDSDVRAVLTPLVHLAYERRIAVIVIMHFNKKVDVTNALLRISNSLAFGGVARHVFSVTDDEENGRKLLARAKNNIAAKSDNQTLAFHFDTREVGNDPETGEVIRAPLVVFEPGYVDVTATEALSAVNENKAPAGRDRAKQFVLDFLRDGQAVLATEMKAAAEANGISWRTINRAKEQLLDKGIIITVAKDNSTPDGPWFWKLET